MLLLLFLVVLSNGINPAAAARLPVLIVAAAMGLPLVAIWLLTAGYAVRRQRQRWALAAEFSVPLCTAVPVIIIFEGANALACRHERAVLACLAYQRRGGMRARLGPCASCCKRMHGG